MPRWWAKLFRAQASHLRVGHRGEKTAARFLKKSKYTILERNTRLPAGELDLVCLSPDQSTIVVVEVKARSLAPGALVEQFMPERHITPSKRAKLRQLTQSLRKKRGWLDRPIRIDVVAVDLVGKKKPTVRHYINAV